MATTTPIIVIERHIAQSPALLSRFGYVR